MTKDFYTLSARSYVADPKQADQIEELAKKAKAGDKRAKAKLTDILGGIAVAVSSKQTMNVSVRGLTTEDLRQEAMVGMYRALENWNPEKSTFRTHAFNMARWHVLNAINEGHLVSINRNYALAYESSESPSFKGLSQETKTAAIMATQVMLSLDFVPDTDEENDNDVQSYQGAFIENGYRDIDTGIALKQAIERARLSEREVRSLLGKYHLNGFTMKGAAEHYGVSDTTVCNWAKRAERKIQVANQTPATRRMAS